MNGSCLCGNVTFKVNAEPKGMSVCHCGQCRKQSGHVWASAFVPVADLDIKGEPKWFAASPIAQRGFCPVCGSFLFWQGHGESTISFALGAIDGPTDLRLTKHIFTADKGDYYDIADGIPQTK
jgi:hypothetical protein